MKTKLLELRDTGTFIPLLCVDMNPDSAFADAQHYLLHRCGYPCDGRPNIGITHASADGTFSNDPYRWSGSRTYAVAHRYIIENWETLKDGDVVDVEYILGETDAKKPSERGSL